MATTSRDGLSTVFVGTNDDEACGLSPLQSALLDWHRANPRASTAEGFAAGWKAREKASEHFLLSMAIEAGYRACERGWNLQKTRQELLGK